MTDSQRTKRKNRKFRLKDLSKLDLETGKLYRFNGRFRKVYRTKNMQEVSYQERRDTYKIRKGDMIMFFGADLWRASGLKKKLVRANDLKKTKANLERANYKIVSVEPFRSRSSYYTRSKMHTISYKNKEEEYSGRLYIGHGEKFGWINIVQLNKEKILQQFEKVNI